MIRRRWILPGITLLAIIAIAIGLSADGVGRGDHFGALKPYIRKDATRYAIVPEGALLSHLTGPLLAPGKGVPCRVREIDLDGIDRRRFQALVTDALNREGGWEMNFGNGGMMWLMAFRDPAAQSGVEGHYIDIVWPGDDPGVANHFDSIAIYECSPMSRREVWVVRVRNFWRDPFGR